MYCKECGTENKEDSLFCKNCGAKLEAPEPEVTYLYADAEGNSYGPVNKEGLQKKYDEGVVDAETYVWKKGLGEWEHAERMKELAPIFLTPNAGGSRRAFAKILLPSAPPVSYRQLFINAIIKCSFAISLYTVQSLPLTSYT